MKTTMVRKAKGDSMNASFVLGSMTLLTCATIVIAQTGLPASPNDPKRAENPIIAGLNTMPKALWPTKDETSSRAQARNEWIRKAFPAGTLVKGISGTLSDSAQGTFDPGAFTGSRGGAAKHERVSVQNVGIRCPADSLWGSPVQVLVEAAVADVPSADVLAWTKGMSLAIDGQILWVTVGSGVVQVNMGVSHLVSSPPAQPATQRAIAAAKPIPNPVVTKLNSMPRDLWPVDGETDTRSQLRNKWIENAFPTGLELPSVSGVVESASARTIMDRGANQRTGRRGQPAVKKDVEDITVDCGNYELWGRIARVRLYAEAENVSPQQASQWNRTTKIRVLGPIDRVDVRPDNISISLRVSRAFAN
jgi:hypothetical protein